MYCLFLMQTHTEVCRCILYTTKKPQTKVKQESRSPISFLLTGHLKCFVSWRNALLDSTLNIPCTPLLPLPSISPSLRKTSIQIPPKVSMRIILLGLTPVGCPGILQHGSYAWGKNTLHGKTRRESKEFKIVWNIKQ